MKKLITLFLITFSFMSFSLFKTEATGIYTDTFSYFENNSTSHYLYSQYSFAIPETFTSFAMYIPKTSYYEANAVISGTTFRSYMQFYNDDGIFLGYFYFDDIDFSTEYNNSTTGILYNLELIIPELTSLGATAFTISFIQSYADRPIQGYLEWFNARFTLAFDTEELGVNTGIYNMIYKVDNQPYYTLGYSSSVVPDKPLDPVKENYIFKGWKTDENDIYTFINPLPNIVGTTRTMTAMFQLTYDNTEPVIENNTPSFLQAPLASIGFDNVAGRLFIYFIVMITITILMVHYELDTFINLIINLFLYGLVIFFGWLPIYAIIIFGLFYILGFIMYFKGGN